MQSRSSRLTASLLVLATVAFAILQLRPVDPGQQAMESGYDPVRALHSLQSLAREPHPHGSQALSKVREELLRQIRACAVEPELQVAVNGKRFDGARPTNLVVHLPGWDSTGSVLLMAHYDTVEESPGAADDGSGVVALLETLRVLVDQPRRNDLILLFTDAEERGMFGAQFFVEDHELFADVDLVLNFEAIGNSGPLMMFETGPGSGGLVDLWRATVPQPNGNSLAAVIYGWMPNNTDMSLFLDAGKRGLNFALSGSSGFYHSPQDLPEHLPAGSLAQMGDTAIRMAQRLGQVDLRQLDREPRAFHNIGPMGLLIWQGRGHLWACAGCLGLALVIAPRKGLLGRRDLNPRELFGGFVGVLSVIFCAGTLATGLAWASYRLSGSIYPLTYDGVNLLLIPMLAGGFLGTIVVSHFWTRGAFGYERGRQLLFSGLGLWLALSLVFARIDLDQVGAGFPFAVTTTGLGIAICLRLSGRTNPIWVALCLLPGMFVMAPLLCQLVQLSSKVVDGSILLGGVLVAIGAPLLLPLTVALVHPEDQGAFEPEA